MLHGDEGRTQWGQLGVGQVPAGGGEDGGGEGLRREKATDLPWDLESSTAPPEPQFPPPSEGEALTMMPKGPSSSEVPWAHNKGLLVRLFPNWLRIGGTETSDENFSTSAIGRSKSGMKPRLFPRDTHFCKCTERV